MFRTPITNVSTSKYHATEEEIETCKQKPSESVFIDAQPNEKYPIYTSSTKGWCEGCNRAYHRSCDDMFQVLTAKHGLQFDKNNPDSLVNTMTLCDLPKDIKKLTPLQVQKYKDQYQDVITAASKCSQLRQNHHQHCSFNTGTKTFEGDPGHQQWLKSLKKVREKCVNSIQQIRRTGIEAQTPVKQMPSSGKLQSPTKSLDEVTFSPIRPKKLTFS